jgi:hypothetical protein
MEALQVALAVVEVHLEHNGLLHTMVVAAVITLRQAVLIVMVVVVVVLARLTGKVGEVDSLPLTIELLLQPLVGAVGLAMAAATICLGLLPPHLTQIQ